MLNGVFLFLRRVASGNLLSFKSKSTCAMCHLEIWYLNVFPWYQNTEMRSTGSNLEKCRGCVQTIIFFQLKLNAGLHPRPNLDFDLFLATNCFQFFLSNFKSEHNLGWNRLFLIRSCIFVDLCRWQDTLYKIWWIIHSSHISRPGGWSWQVSHARNRSYSVKKHPRNMELRKISFPPRNDIARRLRLIYKQIVVSIIIINRSFTILFRHQPVSDRFTSHHCQGAMQKRR